METKEIERLVQKRKEQVREVLEFANHITCEHQRDKECLFMIEKDNGHYYHFKLEELLFEVRIENYPIYNKNICIWEEKSVNAEGISYPFFISFVENSLENADVIAFDELFWPKLMNVINNHNILIEALKIERDVTRAQEEKQRMRNEKRKLLEKEAKKWKVPLE